MVNKSYQKLLSKLASKKILKQNTEVLKSFEYYKELSDLLERADIALGKKTAFKVPTGSTLNFEINQYGIASTTAQKI